MTRFGPLVLLGNIVDLTQGYGQRLPLFNKNSKITTHRHMTKVSTFIDLEELDADDSKM